MQVRVEKSPKLVGRAAREKVDRIHGLGIDEILALPRARGRVLPHAVDKGPPVKAPLAIEEADLLRRAEDVLRVALVGLVGRDKFAQGREAVERNQHRAAG